MCVMDTAHKNHYIRKKRTYFMNGNLMKKGKNGLYRHPGLYLKICHQCQCQEEDVKIVIKDDFQCKLESLKIEWNVVFVRKSLNKRTGARSICSLSGKQGRQLESRSVILLKKTNTTYVLSSYDFLWVPLFYVTVGGGSGGMIPIHMIPL